MLCTLFKRFNHSFHVRSDALASRGAVRSFESDRSLTPPSIPPTASAPRIPSECVAPFRRLSIHTNSICSQWSTSTHTATAPPSTEPSPSRVGGCASAGRPLHPSCSVVLFPLLRPSRRSRNGVASTCQPAHSQSCRSRSSSVRNTHSGQDHFAQPADGVIVSCSDAQCHDPLTQPLIAQWNVCDCACDCPPPSVNVTAR